MFIFVIALILFGPRQLPKIGQSLGRALGEFRRASNEFKRTVEEEVAAEEIRQVEKDLRKVAHPLSEESRAEDTAPSTPSKTAPQASEEGPVEPAPKEARAGEKESGGA